VYGVATNAVRAVIAAEKGYATDVVFLVQVVTTKHIANRVLLPVKIVIIFVAISIHGNALIAVTSFVMIVNAYVIVVATPAVLTALMKHVKNAKMKFAQDVEQRATNVIK
jgi:hypothetical protein